MCCGSGRRPTITTQAAGASGQEVVSTARWRVTFPNGSSVDYDWEWQAAQALARSGGVLKELPAGEHTGAP